MNCLHCGARLPAGSRRDRSYCNNKCSALASYYRRKNGTPPPPRWQHPALTSDSPLLRAAAERPRQLGEAHDWSRSTIRCAMDGLTVLLDGRADDERVTLTEIRPGCHRAMPPPRASPRSSPGSACSRTTPSRQSAPGSAAAPGPAAGFDTVVRDWLLVLLDCRPPVPAQVRYHHLRLLHSRPPAHQPLVSRPRPPPGGHYPGHQGRAGQPSRAPASHHDLGGPVAVPVRQEARADLRQPRPAAEGRRPWTQPAADDRGRDPCRRAGDHPAGGGLIVALAAVHAARWEAIRDLTLDDLDLPSRASPSPSTPSASATSATRRCGRGLTTAAPPGLAHPQPARPDLGEDRPRKGLSPGAT